MVFPPQTVIRPFIELFNDFLLSFVFIRCLFSVFNSQQLVLLIKSQTKSTLLKNQNPSKH